jgi:hypothetical protein
MKYFQQLSINKRFALVSAFTISVTVGLQGAIIVVVFLLHK